eukprot:CAMPEP_0197033076 /NCGR_PEP_ID=MMETSP1384-20130603/11576_1 /TAXON_ID=29189 /ORGANISM="Ammonia sp." /LENGTH=723 /DNA_ID=CAMNT_0042462829 /DNA_START=76 /DNA_END=2247 /DNA_ORIENTATION=+
MYADVVDLAMDQQLLSEINERTGHLNQLPVWKELRAKTCEEIDSLKRSLSNANQLTFEYLFAEPIGHYWFKSYLETQDCIDKATFIHDVEIYKSLNDRDARKETMRRIFEVFCGPQWPERQRGNSCLIDIDKITSCLVNKNKNTAHIELSKSKSNYSTNSINKFEPSTTQTNSKLIEPVSELSDFQPASLTLGDQLPLKTSVVPSHSSIHNHCNSVDSETLANFSEEPHEQTSTQQANSKNDALPDLVPHDDTDDASQALMAADEGQTNAIGIYGSPINRLRSRVVAGQCAIDIFDEILELVTKTLKLEIFPRFQQSALFDMYLRCKTVELKEISLNSFHSMRMLGRGAFGSVNACKKRDTGKLYAMKQIDKRRVQATDSVHALIAERDFLSRMDSPFVTSLKYAFMDQNTLYLIMDLMTAGDLKFHLNRDGVFAEPRARFYAAQILLGMEHIHSKGIIYRDLKLENVLVDEQGHIKISDLGLAVSMHAGLVRGYAGTPGYTAPEVVLTQYYDQQVDFFSYGVVIYRSLSGKKPFAKRKQLDPRANDLDRMKKTSIELDRNVVELMPLYDHPRFTPISRNICRALLHKNAKCRLGANGFHEIKQHPWFDCIDWGLLENGYLKPPFTPTLDQVHAEQQQYIGRPPDDEKFAKIKLTSEFNQSLQGFPFSSSKVIQAELVDVLHQVHSERKKASTNGETVEQMYAFPQPDEVSPKNHCLAGCIVL